jgi:hypothetical protein
MTRKTAINWTTSLVDVFKGLISSVKLMAEIMKTANTNNGYSNPLYIKYIKTEIGNTIPPPLIVTIS